MEDFTMLSWIIYAKYISLDFIDGVNDSHKRKDLKSSILLITSWCVSVEVDSGHLMKSSKAAL